MPEKSLNESNNDLVQVFQEGRVLVLAINRPDKKNALTLDMYGALVAGLEKAKEDSSVRVAMIRGTEDIFTSGNDIKDFLQNPPRDESAPVFKFLRAISTFPKPLVAAVSGVAVGVGTTMLFHCDLVYASDSAKFQFPFVNLALVPEACASMFLPQLVGHQKAFELFCFGEMFDAKEAQRMNLVSDVFSKNVLFEEALNKCTRIAEKAPAAVRGTKALLRSQIADVQNRITEEAKLFSSQLMSKEVAEALQAFLEKRAPNFDQFE